VAIDDFDLVGIVFSPNEASSVLIVDPNAVLAFAASSDDHKPNMPRFA
jgi:hypothetical protein